MCAIGEQQKVNQLASTEALCACGAAKHWVNRRQHRIESQDKCEMLSGRNSETSSLAVPEEFSWAKGGRTQLGSAMYTTYIAEIFFSLQFLVLLLCQSMFSGGAQLEVKTVSLFLSRSLPSEVSPRLQMLKGIQVGRGCHPLN